MGDPENRCFNGSPYSIITVALFNQANDIYNSYQGGLIKTRTVVARKFLTRMRYSGMPLEKPVIISSFSIQSVESLCKHQSDLYL